MALIKVNIDSTNTVISVEEVTFDYVLDPGVDICFLTNTDYKVGDVYKFD